MISMTCCKTSSNSCSSILVSQALIILESTGVYIAEMEQQKNKIEETSDENAHFNAEGPKYLRYRFVSKGHEYMIGE